MATIRILYFASLAQALNCREETFEAEHLPITIEHLKEQLVARGTPWGCLKDTQTKAAINQTLAKMTSLINENDEVAFFPPVTGG